MYLIAACLPTLRIVFSNLHNLIKSSVYLFVQRYQASHEIGENHTVYSDKIPLGTKRKQVDIKLTGVGKLETLLREGNKVLSHNDTTVRDREAHIQAQPDPNPVEVCF